jgi:general secretion pathway protein H
MYGIKNHQQEVLNKGFTLIELLVVIVLLGIVTSFAVLSMGTGSLQREMEEEAKRLHALISLVREEAIIQAKEIALEVDKQEYSFLGYQDKKWTALETKIFHPRKIKEGLEFKIDAESNSTSENKSDVKKFTSDKEDLLRLYFLSSGEQTPFEIKIYVKNEPHPYYQLTGKFNGELKLEYINN